MQGKRTKGTLPQGLKVHSVLAASSQGVPLGLLYHQVWARQEVNKQEQAHRRHRRSEDKESGRWLAAQQAIQDGLPAGQGVLTIAAREAALDDLFALPRPAGMDLLIRAKHDRRLEEADEEVYKRRWAAVRAVRPAITVAFEVPRSHEHRARATKLVIRFVSLTIAPPRPTKNHAIWKPILLQAVLAEELEPPEGETPICWLVLTTLPVTSHEEAVQVLVWSSSRWLIERSHSVLKSGCCIEDLHLETAQRLQRALATYCIVAWRLLWLTSDEAREHPEASCALALEPHEWQALYATLHQRPTVPEQPPTLQQAVRWMARLGGFLDRKSDGEPGVQTIWRGLRRLDDIAATWLLLHPASDQLNCG